MMTVKSRGLMTCSWHEHSKQCMMYAVPATASAHYDGRDGADTKREHAGKPTVDELGAIRDGICWNACRQMVFRA